MIYIDENIDGYDLEQGLREISPQRREYALRYRNERDQRCCVAAYLLLQRALRQEYGITELPELVHDQNGKPSLAGRPDIHVSLSHCRDAVACVVSDQPIGIDVETRNHYSPEVAQRVMSEEEMCHIMASSDPATAFTRLWTMKESLFKLTGDDQGGDIARMLDNAKLFRFTTVATTAWVLTTCQHAT